VNAQVMLPTDCDDWRCHICAVAVVLCACFVCIHAMHTVRMHAHHELFGRCDEAVDFDESKLLTMHSDYHVLVWKWACMQSHSTDARLSKPFHEFDRHVSFVPSLQR